jgi:hypothetical protein
MHASGTFVIDEWTDDPIDDGEGTPRGRAHVRKTFSGGLEGRGAAELLFAGTPVEGSRAYVGLERVTGRLAGRDGTFLLLHTATGDRGEQRADWVIVADSGTGGLTGLAGTARISATPGGGHTIAFDYTLG